MMKSNFRARLDWLDSNLVTEPDGEIVLEETAKGGEARLVCKLNNYTIAFTKLEDSKLTFVKHGKCADYLLLEMVDEEKGQWVMHVIEFKRTITKSQWEKVKNQFKGAILMGLACTGILGISNQNIREIRCYTGYRSDKLSRKDAPSPALIKPLVGRKVDASLLDWDDDNIRLDIVEQLIQHSKILLEKDTGNGEYEI